MSLLRLEAVGFSETEEGVVKFGDRDASRMNDYISASFMRNLREWLLTKFGKADADEVVPGYLVEDMEAAGLVSPPEYGPGRRGSAAGGEERQEHQEKGLRSDCEKEHRRERSLLELPPRGLTRNWDPPVRQFEPHRAHKSPRVGLRYAAFY